MIRLASEKRSERAFLCLRVFREFALDASKTTSFSVFFFFFFIRYALREAQMKRRLFKNT